MAKGSLIGALLVLPFTYGAYKTIKFLTWYFQVRRSFLSFPGPPLHSFLMGNIPDMSKNRRDELQKSLDLISNYGEKGALHFFMGPVPTLSVFSPEVASLLLSSSRHLSKGILYVTLLPWLGQGLLTSSGERWRERRKLITPAFHFDILIRFLEVMNEQADVLVSKLDWLQGKDETVNIFDLISLCTLDIICETAMGRKIDAQLTGKKSEYVEAVKRMSCLVVDRVENPLHLFDFIYKRTEKGREHDKCLSILHSFARKVIQERKEILLKQGGEDEKLEGRRRFRPAFLDILLRAESNGEPLDDEDIREEVDTFMFEGHDTLSAALGWAFFLIGTHPEIQAKIHQELDEILLSRSSPITHEQLSQLKYLDYVIKECLRLYPSVPLIARVVSEEIEIAGIKIPKGANVNVSIYGLLHNERLWEEPERFWPERWEMEMEDKNPFLYIPFSAGPRNCIGQKFAVFEEKVILGKVLSNFEVTAIEPEKVESCPELVLRPKNIFLKLKKR